MQPAYSHSSLCTQYDINDIKVYLTKQSKKNACFSNFGFLSRICCLYSLAWCSSSSVCCCFLSGGCPCSIFKNVFCFQIILAKFMSKYVTLDLTLLVEQQASFCVSSWQEGGLIYLVFVAFHRKNKW